jgi:hypothetical protein
MKQIRTSEKEIIFLYSTSVKIHLKPCFAVKENVTGKLLKD